jgi:hypothetical protein
MVDTLNNNGQLDEGQEPAPVDISEIVNGFMSLFNGRTDVYGSVEGRSIKAPVARQLYADHLAGKKSIGIYPLLDDGMINFFAVDLDEKNFAKAVSIRNELNTLGVKMYVCQSKSKGFHVYGFGDGPLVAKNVREMLTRLLIKLNIQAEVFPKQDNLDEVIKYGNYINLPCFGDTRPFLTADQQPVATDVALKLIQRNSQEMIDKATQVLPPIPSTMIPIVKPEKKGKTSSKALKSPPCVEKLLEGVESGMRDEAAFAIARHLLDQGLIPEEVLSRLVAWDACNKPPLADRRTLQTKVESAQRGYGFGCKSITSGLLSYACKDKGNCIWANQLMTAAEKEQFQKEEHERLLALAKPLLEDPALLNKAIHAVENLGVVGERKNIGLIHLQARSRALSRPVNIEVNSPSSAGKTQVVMGTLALEDPTAFYELTASSEKALIYSEEPLVNRILYIQEPEGLAQGAGFAAMKSLIWEGRLKYDTVVKEDGKFIGKHIEKEGPTGLIVTSTIGLEVQITNRLLRTEVDTSNEQTRRILKSIAEHFIGSIKNIDLAPWHALSKILGSPIDAEIPFAGYLSEEVSASALRIRRDFTHLLSLIQASAIEYQYQRSRSSTGRITATVADYAHVYTLAKDTFQAAQEDGITGADRDMVAAVMLLTTSANGKPGDKPVSQADIAENKKMSKSQVSYRVNRLLKAGYLANQETVKGKPHKLVPGAALPDKVPPLPTPGQLSEWLIKNDRTDLIIPWVNPISGAVHNCANYLSEPRELSIAPCQNRTPDPCEHCPQNEAKKADTVGGSGTIRTPEHPEKGKVKSSGGSGEAEPPPPKPSAESNNTGSSVVRLNDGKEVEKETTTTIEKSCEEIF